MNRQRNGLVWCLLISGAELALCGCGSPTDDELVGGVSQAIVSGTDDRLDIFQLPTGDPARRNADGVALLVAASLTPHDGVVDITSQTFQQQYGLCSGERYATQPVAIGGYCTAYLVAPRLVVTAGHCMNYAPVGSDASQFRVVFGFQADDTNTVSATVPESEVYTAVRVAAVCDDRWDCSVLELDRPVTNHVILPVRRDGQVSESDSVYVLGHPFSLPLKYDGPVPITSGVSSGIFLAAAQLDVAGGNSGSPVFNAVTNVVEATLSGYSSSGAPAFDLAPEGCSLEHVATPDDNYTVTATLSSLFASHVPPRCASDAGGWSACHADGCAVCASKLDTQVYDLYLQHHPNCSTTADCAGQPSPCSEACPVPGPSDSSRPSPIRIEVGGAADYLDAAQQRWSADAFAGDGEVVDRGNIVIAGTRDPRIYQTERYAMSGYKVPVAPGSYTVRLHFAETYPGITDCGQRVFDVTVEQEHWNHVDVFALAGGRNRAFVKEFHVQARDGWLDITFARVRQNPLLNGLEIIPASVPGHPHHGGRGAHDPTWTQ